jgi:type IV pilus assembly protein PilC
MKQNLTNSELSVFSQQLSMILHSGISVLEGISILREDTPEGEGKELLGQIYETLEMTGELAGSLKQTGAYPEYFIKMTEVGERCGTLEEVMAALSSYYDRQDKLIRSIRDALVYPLILLGMLLAVLIVLMTQVMPVFEQVFEQLGIEITGLSGAVFGIGRVLQNISIVLLVFLVAAALICLILTRSEKGRALLHRFVLYLPMGKHTEELMSCSRFCDALAIAVHSGLDMYESFELASSLSELESFSQKTARASELVNEGSDLAQALKEAGIITGMNARMVSIGFHTGSAEIALKQIAIGYQEDADRHIQSAVSALEPTLTAVLSILTGLILVSVMLPLLGVMTNIG